MERILREVLNLPCRTSKDSVEQNRGKTFSWIPFVMEQVARGNKPPLYAVVSKWSYQELQHREDSSFVATQGRPKVLAHYFHQW